jgi:hypothetical protein
MTTAQRVTLLAGQSCVSLAGVFIALIIFTPAADAIYALSAVVLLLLGVLLIAASHSSRHNDSRSNDR